MSPRTADSQSVAVAGIASACTQLSDLDSAARACVACSDLVSVRTNVVPGDFPSGARLLLVGEAPGAQEDLAGRPFVGKAGGLLDRLLAEVGLDRAGLAVTNVVKCRPPGNRVPTRLEASRCTGFLDRQVEIADPALVVTLGGTALAWALGPGVRLADTHGLLHPWRGRQLLPTYHPSAAIRFGPNGGPMAALRADLQLAADVLAGR